MCPSSSSPQWLCGNMPAMDGQWRSSRIVSVRTNRLHDFTLYVLYSFLCACLALCVSWCHKIINILLLYIIQFNYMQLYTILVYRYRCIYRYIEIYFLKLKFQQVSNILTQDTTSWQIFFSNLLNLLHSIFSIIVWTNKCHDFDERIYFPDNFCYGNR